MLCERSISINTCLDIFKENSSGDDSGSTKFTFIEYTDEIDKSKKNHGKCKWDDQDNLDVYINAKESKMTIKISLFPDEVKEISEIVLKYLDYMKRKHGI